MTPEDIIRTAATVAALADPTGIAGVIGAYTHTKCDVVKKMLGEIWSSIKQNILYFKLLLNLTLTLLIFFKGKTILHEYI